MATDKNIIDTWNSLTLEEKRQALAEYELRMRENTDEHYREGYNSRTCLVDIAD